MADFTEQQVYEAFGLGAQVQEPADPASDPSQVNTAQGEQVQDPAAPAEAVETNPADGDPTDSGGESGNQVPEDQGNPEPGKQPLTAEQRRENAARRRQQEQQAQQAAINEAVQAALQQEQQKTDAMIKDFFDSANLKNTITGQPINTMDEFREWKRQFADAKLERDLKAGKLTAETLETAIGNHPVVKQAQQLIDREDARKQEQSAADAKAKVAEEIAEIHKIDESINSLEDLFAAPYGKELYAMAKRGYSLRDAHYLLNRERLEIAKLEAAKQQGMNNVRSKEHMTATTNARGGGAVSVPAADLAIFRQFNPGATDAQIQAYYNNYIKKGG